MPGKSRIFIGFMISSKIGVENLKKTQKLSKEKSSYALNPSQSQQCLSSYLVVVAVGVDGGGDGGGHRGRRRLRPLHLLLLLLLLQLLLRRGSSLLE